MNPPPMMMRSDGLLAIIVEIPAVPILSLTRYSYERTWSSVGLPTAEDAKAISAKQSVASMINRFNVWCDIALSQA